MTTERQAPFRRSGALVSTGLLAFAIGVISWRRGCCSAMMGISRGEGGLRHGYIDVRPKHASAAPRLLYAAEEPFWFYGIVAVLALLVLMLVSIASRMWRSPAAKRSTSATADASRNRAGAFRKRRAVTGEK